MSAPLPWFRFDVAEVATARGGTRVLGDDAALAAMMRFAWRSWREGRLTEDDARQTCGDGFDVLLSAMLERGADGLLALPWLESTRTEMDARRLERREAGRRGGLAKAAAAKLNPSSAIAQLGSAVAKGTEKSREEESRGDSVPSGRQPAPGGASAGALFENPKKPKADAKKGEHVLAIETFQRAWARLRHGEMTVTAKTDPKDIPAHARYEPTTADWAAAARLWKRIGGDVPLLRERMANFFDSDAPFIRAGGFALFASKFDVLFQPIMALNGSHADATRE